MMKKAEEASTLWCVGRAFYMALWLSASACVGLGALEFGAALDGVGYGHLSSPTYVTVLVLHVVGAAIGFVAYRAYRGVIGYTAGFLLGFVFWVPVAILAAFSLDWHYGRVCDTAEAPDACYAAVWKQEGSCLPEVDDTCFKRLERSCEFGNTRGCDMLVANGSWSEAQVCEALSDRCAEALECGTRGFPQHCDEDSVAGWEAFVTEMVCQDYEERCGASTRR